MFQAGVMFFHITLESDNSHGVRCKKTKVIELSHLILALKKEFMHLRIRLSHLSLPAANSSHIKSVSQCSPVKRVVLCGASTKRANTVPEVSVPLLPCGRDGLVEAPAPRQRGVRDRWHVFRSHHLQGRPPTRG